MILPKLILILMELNFFEIQNDGLIKFNEISKRVLSPYKETCFNNNHGNHDH